MSYFDNCSMKMEIIGNFVNFSSQVMLDYEDVEYFVKKVADNRSGKPEMSITSENGKDLEVLRFIF